MPILAPFRQKLVITAQERSDVLRAQYQMDVSVYKGPVFETIPSSTDYYVPPNRAYRASFPGFPSPDFISQPPICLHGCEIKNMGEESLDTRLGLKW